MRNSREKLSLRDLATIQKLSRSLNFLNQKVDPRPVGNEQFGLTPPGPHSAVQTAPNLTDTGT